MPGSLFDKTTGCRSETLLKRDSGAGIFLCILQNLLRTSFDIINTCGRVFLPLIESSLEPLTAFQLACN